MKWDTCYKKQSSKWLVVHNELIEAGTGFWSKSLHSHVADRGGIHLARCWNQLFASLLQWMNTVTAALHESFIFRGVIFFSIVREVLIVLQFLSSLWWNSFNLCLLGVFHINIRYKNVTQIKNKNVMVNAKKGICTSVRSTDRCKFNHQVALFSQVIPGTIEKHLHLSNMRVLC